MNWTLLHDDVPVARLTQVDLDDPWFVCDLRREPALAPLVGGEDEAEWLELHATLRPDDGPPSRTFLLTIVGDAAYLRC